MIKRFSKTKNIPHYDISVEKKSIHGDFPTHWHDFNEIEFIIEGSGTYIVDGKKYAIEKNMLFFMTPVNFHSVNIDKDGADIINVMFSEDLCNPNTLLRLTSVANENAILFPKKDANFIIYLLEELIFSVQKKNTAYYRSLIDTLLLKIISCANNKSNPKLTYVQSAMLFIRNNFRSKITLSDTAKHIGISPAYLSTIFLKESGINFKDYLNTIRFDYAKKLLIYSDASITELCYESGFDDYANFIRSFRLKFGMPPGKYRKQSKNF